MYILPIFGCKWPSSNLPLLCRSSPVWMMTISQHDWSPVRWCGWYCWRDPPPWIVRYSYCLLLYKVASLHIILNHKTIEDSYCNLKNLIGHHPECCYLTHHTCNSKPHCLPSWMVRSVKSALSPTIPTVVVSLSATLNGKVSEGSSLTHHTRNSSLFFVMLRKNWRCE